MGVSVKGGDTPEAVLLGSDDADGVGRAEINRPEIQKKNNEKNHGGKLNKQDTVISIQ